MERIVVVINANKPDIAPIDFACRVAKLAYTDLTGLFIENPQVEFISAGIENPDYLETTHKIADTIIVDTEQSIRIFKEECLLRGINQEVCISRGEPVKSVIFESRFADLLIVDPGISFYNREEPLPSYFVRELLTETECPVLLAPEKFSAFGEIVFCYDGSDSSVFAMKQFSYLFPNFSFEKLTLLEITHSGEKELDKGHTRMMDWLRCHYNHVDYHKTYGNAGDELFNYFFMQKEKCIVIGAYGRSLLSNIFRKSKAEVLIRTIDLPIFIAHH